MSQEDQDDCDSSEYSLSDDDDESIFRNQTRQCVSVEEEDRLSQEEQDDCSNSTLGDEDHSDDALYSEELSTSISEAPDMPPSTRKVNKKHRYVAGKSKKSYKLSSDLQKVLSDNEPTTSNNQAMVQHVEWSKWDENVCKSCTPVLEKYCTAFKDMKRQGSELKQRKLINPHRKQADKEHYRDLVKQNEWLRNNIFDAAGNYLFCCRCVHYGMGISFQRLARQRNIKRKQFSKPL